MCTGRGEKVNATTNLFMQMQSAMQLGNPQKQEKSTD